MSGTTGRDSTPLSTVSQLVEYFQAGAKPRAAWRVGIEQEKIATSAAGAAVPFDGPAGIETLLRRLAAHGYTGTEEGGRLVALTRGGDRITLEPGGQVELSGSALLNAAACGDVLGEHVREVREAGRELGMRFLGVGLQPFAAPGDLPWLPKRRYHLMREYLPQHGRLGHAMMQRTATVQANFDYDDETTAADKIRTAFGVTSIVTALYAASPLEGGRPSGLQSGRAAIWLDTDESRCGLLPFAFADGFGFRDYVEWALDVPMFFVVRGSSYHPVGGITFRRFMREGWQGQPATVRDWEMHLSTLFPEVRLKRYIEVRGADAGPLPMAKGLGALWRGLLDHDEARRAAWDLVRTVDVAERERVRREVPRTGLGARLGGRLVAELALELCRISAGALGELPGGDADVPLLEPLTERAAAARSPADDMLADYQATGGDPAKLVARWELRL
jgi:glutamate--cysteine ligase